MEISQEELKKMIAEAISVAREEERKKEELKKRKNEYIEKIKQYFPGAKDEILQNRSAEDLQKMVEKLDNIAKGLGYSPPPRRKEVMPKSFMRAIKENIVMVAILLIITGAAITAAILR